MAIEKQHAHELIDRLPVDQRSAAVSYLQFLLLDPVSRALAAAPVDDEPDTEEERQAVERSKEWFKKNPKGIPHEEVLADFSLTAEDVENFKDAG